MRGQEHALLFGLLVPPPETHLARVDVDAYEHQKLRDLVIGAMFALPAANVEPDVWKLQGLDDRAVGEPAVVQAWAGGRDGVVCIVLGHGADDARVRHWLPEAARMDGYVGFAAGRTVWCNARGSLGARRCARATTRTKTAGRYREMIDVYEPGASPGREPAITSADRTPRQQAPGLAYGANGRGERAIAEAAMIRAQLRRLALYETVTIDVS